jgi:hypothetical protein
MTIGRTLMGKRFEYSGSLAEGLRVNFSTTSLKIDLKTIAIIRGEIERRSPVKMGASRSPLVLNSVGETLWGEHRVSPQVMSYVLPLLIAEGFYSVSP